MSGADFITEEQRLAQFPHLRPIVETIQLHAGAGDFYGGGSPDDPSGWGWTWQWVGGYDGPRAWLSLDCDGEDEPLVLVTFDPCNDDQGPATEASGNIPTVALAEACGRWIASKIGLTNTSGHRFGGLVVATG